MKKYLLLALTVLLISCSKQEKTVEATVEPTTTPEVVESVKPTETPIEEETSKIPEEALNPEVQEILKESPNQFKATYREGIPTIDQYYMIYKGKNTDLDPNLGTEVYFVPVFGDYKHNDIVGLYEDEVTEKTVLQPKKIKKAVVFYEKTEE